VAGTNQDIDVIDGYLCGDATSCQVIGRYINAALGPFRERLGYQVDDVRSDVEDELRTALGERQFRGEAQLKTFVSRVVSHTAIDYIRYNRRFADGDPEEAIRLLPDKLPDPERELERNQLLRLLWRVVRRLPRDCVKILRMHERDGLTCAMIGQVIGKKEDRVRRRMWECRREAERIREELLRPDKRL